ncbi:hypothetical protein [Jannaschia sp. W003]|nr:hypothetical protein [Jannaschia sp. W003]
MTNRRYGLRIAILALAILGGLMLQHGAEGRVAHGEAAIDAAALG